ncbi:hypothetical protein GLOTRDRAFT_140992 [Gloeophyllum trabeum ATCC 11539]|uniref:Uncharacterized protein n=1 Tax=Gloeophyllum trabeum (strain ATCC 11539 / FP-39264 / Madison 617) TaxID=670483 RepID=S7PVF5_GLOTA|nr:uncharacterized protein GLOTRDRAFT_140992 [Gloeophyllum trabeum ATCC 11539]EPQ51616.1 hypothetical protein GLOTRDRAFT_140992 [Gloeophyllum trabeum ATCC 11539]
MFGESDSESPRVPSPWDPFISASPSPCSLESNASQNFKIKKLAPEAEDGNVEYKLQLLSPSPARFARLVTQLKWRLLEGGGQAYYEIGVADSGALIGLSRVQLEESIQTLEEMAGEIGASVIIVKEIELTGRDRERAKEELQATSGIYGRRNRRRNKNMAALLAGDSTATTTTTESELSTADITDAEPDDIEIATPAAYPSAFDVASSPTYVALDDALALFSMDPEPDVSDVGVEADVETDPEPRVAVDLEIASVYKPRPFRRRVHAHGHVDAVAHGKRGLGKKAKKILPSSVEALKGVKTAQEIKTAKEAKLAKRLAARERKKQEKQRTLMAQDYFSGTPLSVLEDQISQSDEKADNVDGLIPALGTLTVEAKEMQAVRDTGPVAALNDGIVNAPLGGSPDDEILPPPADQGEPRLIVEVLVVRKLSLEEAFLDFGGFSHIP